MSYQVLARKYRPQSFDQMIGQNHISQTLINALKNDRLPHAMLFTGLRGTGKTSSARILAKTLRCTQLENFRPCNRCQNCMEITEGRAVDVIEIDGASNNGVDSVRELRENVMFMPTSGKYKIFIIDEVHMLSTSAFNALLKTLEEPPQHVLFMMATTEVHKIPQTILSRCQRFDLRRIPLKQIAQHLKHICELENISADEKALWLIARQGDGSARDSLSLLDQVINFSSSGELTESIVSQILGLTDRSLIYDIYTHLIQRHPQGVVAALEKAHATGLNPNLFLEDLIRLIRHTILLQTAPENETLIDLPQEEISFLKQLAGTTSDSDLHMLFDMALKSMNDLNKTSDASLVLEVCLLRMAQAPRLIDIQKLLSGASLQAARPHTPHEASAPKPIEGIKLQSPPKPAQPIAPRTTEAPPKPAAPVTAKPSPQTWLKFVLQIKDVDAFLGAKLDNLAFIKVDGQRLQLEAAAQFAFLAEQINQADTREKIQGFIDSFFGKGYTFEVVKTKVASGESTVSLTQRQEKESESKLRDELLKDPRVQKAQEVFKAQAKLVSKNND